MPKEYYYEQRSEEWFKVRLGKMTASHAQAIAACGKGLKSYISKMMKHYYFGDDEPPFYNSDIERGERLEERVKRIYSFEQGYQLKDVGFVEYSEHIGCSPDSFVNSDGLAEIKCPNDRKFFSLISDFIVESKYMWQIQMQLYCTEKKWCDYVVYNENFPKLLIQRVFPDEEKFKKLEKGFKKGIELINNIKKEMENE